MNGRETFLFPISFLPDEDGDMGQVVGGGAGGVDHPGYSVIWLCGYHLFSDSDYINKFQVSYKTLQVMQLIIGKIQRVPHSIYICSGISEEIE